MTQNKYTPGVFGFDSTEKSNWSHKACILTTTEKLDANVIRGFFGVRTAIAVAA